MKAEITALLDNSELKHLVQDKFSSQKPRIRELLFACLASLFDKYIELQDSGEKQPLQYIALSYLRTGVYLRTDAYRLDLLDKRYLFDSVPCGCGINIGALFEGIYRKMDEIRLELQYYQVEEYRLESALLDAADKMNALLAEPLSDLIVEYTQTRQHPKIKRNVPVKIVFGDYMDQMIEMAQWGE